jgi:hypothetical protein
MATAVSRAFTGDVADIVRRCRGLPLVEPAMAGVVVSENVAGVCMYELLVDQFLGINGLINLSNIVFLVAFSA